MRIQCDVCEGAAATMICCADEAALCERCDVQVHSANKLASKHQRLLLQNLSSKLPFCDICQEKSAFIFCVEDRALFCRDCDESIHVEGTLSGEHQRLLATGIGVALSSSHKTSVLPYKDSSNSKLELTPAAVQQQAIPEPIPITAAQPHHDTSTASVPAWSVDEFLQLSDYETSDKKGGESSCMDFGGMDWFADIELFPEDSSSLAAAEVPVLKLPASPPAAHYKQQPMQQPKYYSGNIAKKPRIEFSDEDDDLLTVPDLG